MQEAEGFLPGSATYPTAAAQQFPARVLELGGSGTAAQSVTLGPSHKVNCLVEL
jgi:hypothetical protein